MKKYLLSLVFMGITFIADAQCIAGEVEVFIEVNTDDYAYEGYWQLVPAGSNCGSSTIAEGGNLSVGCLGAGAQNQTPGGYGNNLQVNEGPFCLVDGAQYHLIYVDDWGDGGFSFNISVNGYQIESFDGMGLGATYLFTAKEPEQYDLSVSGSNVYGYIETGVFNLDAHVFNNGTETINSYDLNYSIDGGNVFTHNIQSTNLPNFSSEEVTHSIPISITTDGVYSIKIWADNLNGNIDGNNANDTLFRQTEAGPGRPNYLDGYVGGSYIIETIADASDQISDPTDLDFHPVLSNKELWVVNRGTENSGSSTVTLYSAGESNQNSVWKIDGNAWHFMNLTTGIAFSNNGNWANSPGVYDANHDGGSAFTGPALWSSDMSVYAEPSGGNGSHLDMLHASPYCQGVASEKDNVFWIFDGYNNDIVRYDFAADHGPGASFHGDAIIRRYSDNTVAKDPNNVIVSHMVLDENKQWLYVVDHGNQRVIRIDINTGSNLGNPAQYSAYEAVVEYSRIEGYTQETVVSGLSKPAGIDVIANRMIVSEYETGEIVIYDISVLPAVELERINTGFSSVQGIKIGPEGRIWFVDGNTNGVYKIENATLALDKKTVTPFSVFPNPNNGNFEINLDKELKANITISNAMGQIVYSFPYSGGLKTLNIDLEAGLYFLKLIENGNQLATKKILIK